MQSLWTHFHGGRWEESSGKEKRFEKRSAAGQFLCNNWIFVYIFVFHYYVLLKRICWVVKEIHLWNNSGNDLKIWKK